MLVQSEVEAPPKKELACLPSFHQNARVLTKKKSNYHLAKPFHLEYLEQDQQNAERLQTVEVLHTSTFNDDKDMSPQSRVMFKVSQIDSHGRERHTSANKNLSKSLISPSFIDQNIMESESYVIQTQEIKQTAIFHSKVS